MLNKRFDELRFNSTLKGALDRVHTRLRARQTMLFRVHIHPRCIACISDHVVSRACSRSSCSFGLYSVCSIFSRDLYLVLLSCPSTLACILTLGMVMIFRLCPNHLWSSLDLSPGLHDYIIMVTSLLTGVFASPIPAVCL